MNDVFGRVPIEDYISVIRFAEQKINELQRYLDEDDSVDGRITLTNRIQYYKKIVSCNKQTIKRTFNCSVMTGSWVDPVPDNYYLALIDKEGRIKGVIL